MTRRREGPRPKPVVANSGESITESHHAKSMDPGLYAQRLVNGELDLPRLVYADVTARPASLQEALDLVEAREAEFDRLPAQVRAVARNSVARFDRMLRDDELLVDLVEAGLEVEDLPASVTDALEARQRSSEPISSPPEPAPEAAAQPPEASTEGP